MVKLKITELELFFSKLDMTIFPVIPEVVINFFILNDGYTF